MKRTALAQSLLALASYTSAQVASVCPTSDVCFKLNIPQNTASSGNGDIFFQLSAPSSYEWVALGQGSSMSGSNIFVVYTSGSGNNVTISPRLGQGERMPEFNGNAQVTLLEGSGVSGGKMVANVRCSNCNSWSGSSADFTAANGNWIYASHTSSGPKNSDDQSANIAQHDDRNSFQWSYANAKGGDSVNPFVNAAPSGTGSGDSGGGSSGATATSCVPRPTNTAGSVTAGATTATATATTTKTKSGDDDDDNRTWRGRSTWASGWWSGRPTASPTGPPWVREKRQNINYCEDNSNSGFTPISSGGPSNQTKMLIAHGTLAALAFVIFFPAGAIAIRLASFPGVLWLHAAFQVFAYLVYTAAFGLGVYMATKMQLLDEYHPIIGIVVFVLLFFQPIFGFLHHVLFKKYQSRTFWSYAHIWLGRLVVTLGIINGGLGFMLADRMHMSSRSGMIAYAVVAGVIWLVWVAASILGERRRAVAKARADHPPKYNESPATESDQRDIPEISNGHYAPK